MAVTLEKWKVKHVYATAEHPKTSGLVERINRTLTLVIAVYVNTDHDDWDRVLTEAAFAINSANKSATKRIPFELVFGRKPRMPFNNALSWPTDRQHTFKSFVARVETMRKEAYFRVIVKQLKTKALADLRRRVMQPHSPGELVLVRRKNKKNGKPKKLLPKFIGRARLSNKL